jgi:hypothetical protein
LKIYDIYQKYVKNKDAYHDHVGDQDLLNDILFGKVGYLPLKFNIKSPYCNDAKSDKALRSHPYRFYFWSYAKVK